jgi:hypothetical protein
VRADREAAVDLLRDLAVREAAAAPRGDAREVRGRRAQRGRRGAVAAAL